MVRDRTADRPTRRLRAGLLGLAVVASALATAPPATAAPPTAVALGEFVKADADWILTLADGYGAIASKPAHDTVVPYQANLGVEGLARAFVLTRNKNYSLAAWRWMLWYRDHQSQTNGTITNYRWMNDWVSTGTYDSTDSYAGTYLSAARELFRATGDAQQLLAIRNALVLALTAIELTQDTDGLHTATPSWPFKYTMDEAETYDGLQAAVELFTVLGDSSQRDRAQRDANALLAGSWRLIDPDTGLYLWGLHLDGTRVKAPLEWIYPGASAQAWAVAYGLATGSAATTLMERFTQAQPSWTDPNAITQIYPGYCYTPVPPSPPPCYGTVGYWPRASLAFLALGDVTTARDSALAIRQAAVAAGRPYPFTAADAAEIILVLSDPRVLAGTLGP